MSETCGKQQKTKEEEQIEPVYFLSFQYTTPLQLQYTAVF